MVCASCSNLINAEPPLCLALHDLLKLNLSVVNTFPSSCFSVALGVAANATQACPYVICLFFIPCHYYTHMAMFAFTAVWATNIHDAVAGNSEPIMGAKYHTVRDGVENDKASFKNRLLCVASRFQYLRCLSFLKRQCVGLGHRR